MKKLLLRWLGGGDTEEGYRRGYADGLDNARREGIERRSEVWKAGYRFAKDEWAAAREIEDAELAELAMLTIGTVGQ